MPPDRRFRVYRTDDAGRTWTALSDGLPDGPYHAAVLRDAMCTDTADPAGVYVGTRDGEVYASADDGEHWQLVVEHLPDVLSVRALTGMSAVVVRVPGVLRPFVDGRSTVEVDAASVHTSATCSPGSSSTTLRSVAGSATSRVWCGAMSTCTSTAPTSGTPSSSTPRSVRAPRSSWSPRSAAADPGRRWEPVG